MSRWIWVLCFGLLAGCGVTGDLTMDGYASASLYHAEIRECLDQHVCQPLCVKVFELRYDEIDSCRIMSHDDAGANVRVRLYDEDDGFVDIIDDGCSYDCGDDDGDIIIDDYPPDDEDLPPDDGGGSDDGGGGDDGGSSSDDP